MNLDRQHVSNTISTEALNELIVDSIKDIKGKGITKIDLTKLADSPTDFFIVCEGDSSVQIKALSDHIQKRVKQEAALLPDHVEGARSARWILVDFFSTVVHIFFPETRSFYELEDLWSDAEITYYENP